MRKKYLSTLLGMGICLYHFSCAAALTWTSSNGQHHFEGEFVSLAGEALSLKGENEKEITVPLSSLNPESRAQGIALAAGIRTVKGQFLWYHETPAYRIALYSGTSFGVIQFLENGKGILFPPIKLSIMHQEVKGKDYFYKSFKEMAAPVSHEGNRVLWRCSFINGNEAECQIDLDTNGVTLDYRLIVKNKSAPNLQIGVAASLPEVLTYDKEKEKYRGTASASDISYKQIETALKDYSLAYRGYGDRTSERFSFSDTKSGSVNSREIITYKGPFSRKSIEFTGATDKNVGALGMWFYEGGKAIFTGSSVKFFYPKLPTGKMPEAQFKISFK
jgi:hypothetical protein